MKVALQVGKVTLSGLQFGGSFVIDCPLGFVASVVLSGLRLKLDLAPWRAACASLRDDAQALAASARALSAAAQGRAVMQAPQPQQLSDPVPPPTLDDPMWSNEFKDAFKKVDAFKNNKALHYAQRAWLMKSLTLGVTVAGTVLAAVATGLTGGAAAPALVVSTLALRFALANWRCAQQNLKLAEAGKPTLPMGNSAFGNALYTQYIQAGLPDRQARDEANRNAVLAGLLVTALGVGLGFGLAVSLPASAAEAMGGLRMTASLLKNCVLPGVDFVRGKWQAREVDTSDPGRVLRQAARDNWLAFLMNHPVRAAQYRDWLERRSSGMGGLAQALAIETVPAHAQRVAPRPLPSQFDHDTLDLDPLVEWTVGSSAARLNELAQHLGSDSDAWLREIAADLDSRQWRTRESLASDGIDAVFSLQGAISGIVGMA